MSTEAGRLDLLALDPQGRWVVIEIKAGRVRREAVGQALDYASCIASIPMPELLAGARSYRESRGAGGTPPALADLLGGPGSDRDENERTRPVRIFVVGVGRDVGLERMVGFLAERSEIEITVVSFELFATDSGEQLLTRELTEAPPEASSRRIEAAARPADIEAVLEQAARHGIGDAFRAIYDAAVETGLYPRPWKTSIMFAPLANKTRCAVTIWSKPTQSSRIIGWVSPEAFKEFFGISRAQIVAELGQVDEIELSTDDAPKFAAGLRRLLSKTSTAGED